MKTPRVSLSHGMIHPPSGTPEGIPSFGQLVLQMDTVDFENDAVKRYLGELISSTTI